MACRLRIDLAKLRWCLNNVDLTDDQVKTLKCIQRKTKNGFLKGSYAPSPKQPKSRLYFSGGVQFLPSKVRNTILKDYVDIDIKNCFPSLLINICDEHGISCQNLRNYHKNRDEYMKNWKGCKSVVNAMIHDENFKLYHCVKEKPEWLKLLRDEIDCIHYKMKDIYELEFAKISKIDNKIGTLMSNIVSPYEKKVLDKTIAFVNDELKLDTKECLLMYDGFMIPKSVGFNESHLAQINNLVPNVTFTFKPMEAYEASPDEAEFFKNQDDEHFSVSHQGLAELFHEQFKDDFAFYDKQWYVLNEFGILEPMGDNSKPVLKNKIYNFLFPFLTRNLRNNKNFGKIINLIGNASFQQGILLCCEGLFFVPYFTEKTDRNPLIIAFRNGVYDLETFQFRKGRKDDFVTLTTGYDYTPNEDTELFDKLLFSIWEDEPMVHWFKKHLGSLLEGKLTDEYFFIWNGCGRNGKGTIDTLLKSSLGEHSYYSTLSVGYLTKARDDAGKPEPEITKLRNARVVMTTEPDENAVLNTAKIKQISGNDTITGRNLYSNTMISFVAMFKLIFATNYLPQFTDCGDALLARMVPIPFPLQFLNKSDTMFDASNPNIRVADTSLKEKLAKKRSEFFNYMVRGYRLYKAEGINDFPPMVMACRNHYRKQTDVVGAWKEEQMTKASPTDRISTKDLFDNFKLWLMIEGNDEVNIWRIYEDFSGSIHLAALHAGAWEDYLQA